MGSKLDDEETPPPEPSAARHAPPARSSKPPSIFLSRGYTATTMEDLSEAADVAVGSI
jgi:hypothetical protein